MVLPPSTAEELEVVLATKRRRGVSEDPQKVRKAVLELRQRRATAAWKTWYAAQQAAAQARNRPNLDRRTIGRTVYIGIWALQHGAAYGRWLEQRSTRRSCEAT